MTIKEHLKAFHTAAATHHTEMARRHKRLGEHYGKATGMDGHQDLAAEHQAMSDSHATIAEHHLSMCKSVGDDEMGKTVGGDEFDKIRAVVTHFPGVTPVPRAGSPDVAKNVPVEFRHLVTVEED